MWLEEARNHDYAAILLSNGYADSYGKYEAIVGYGAKQIFNCPSDLNHFQGVALGHVSYQYKNFVEHVAKSPSKFNIKIPEFLFFEPESALFVLRDNSQETYGNFVKLDQSLDINLPSKIGHWSESTTREKYLETVQKIRDHIRQGVYYELNYCISFSADADLDPYVLFYYFNEVAPSPFAAFYKIKNQFLLCASPERFLSKSGNLLLSQPIKGTRKRIFGKELETIDELKNHPKDLAENTMIVDLVRNDLSKICIPSTVIVPELCEIHTFSHVHQMISSVQGEMMPKITTHDIFQAMFPMGSMTGAPKIEVMKNIDLLEDFAREFYSGSIGYFKGGDFDLNVVIRSLVYDNHRLTYSVGGAITYDSVAEEEYEECMTKASGIMSLLAKRANQSLE